MSPDQESNAPQGPSKGKVGCACASTAVVPLAVLLVGYLMWPVLPLVISPIYMRVKLSPGQNEVAADLPRGTYVVMVRREGAEPEGKEHTVSVVGQVTVSGRTSPIEGDVPASTWDSSPTTGFSVSRGDGEARLRVGLKASQDDRVYLVLQSAK